MCHARGPHRAWLNNSYIYFLSWIIFELLGGVLSPHSLPWSHIYVERRQKDAGIAEAQIDDVGLLDEIDAYICHRRVLCFPRLAWLRSGC